MVKSFRVLDINITTNLSWSNHVNDTAKKNTDTTISSEIKGNWACLQLLRSLCSCIMENILLGCITAWQEITSVWRRIPTQNTICPFPRFLQHWFSLKKLPWLYRQLCPSNKTTFSCQASLKKSKHNQRSFTPQLFLLLPFSIRRRYKSLKASTSKLKNFLAIIRLLNQLLKIMNSWLPNPSIYVSCIRTTLFCNLVHCLLHLCMGRFAWVPC